MRGARDGRGSGTNCLRYQSGDGETLQRRTYDGFMQALFLDESVSVLARTPGTLDAMLRGLPDVWTAATEGPGTWSSYDVVGHLIHGEKTDWMIRLEIILDHGATRAFDPFDREAQFRESPGKSLPMLLDEFQALRGENLARLHARNLQPAQLDLQGTHPALGPVTLRQLLATWTAHDLAHILQISRVMAKRYKLEVGPWAKQMSVMR
jgi:DinB superfamily